MVFSPAARSWPEMVWSYLTYQTYSVHGWLMCIKISDGARPAVRGGGGCVRASSFPAKDRRTWGNKARVSTGGVQ
jgi:hypothetical protein